jgi:hypothetical protein
MKAELDIYNYPKRLEVARWQLEESSISMRNKALILLPKMNSTTKGVGGVQANIVSHHEWCYRFF